MKGNYEFYEFISAMNFNLAAKAADYYERGRKPYHLREIRNEVANNPIKE